MAGSHLWSGWLSGVAFAAALGLFPFTADAREENASRTLGKVVKPGHAVMVTQWSGEKTQGSVTELTACTLVLRASNESVRVPIHTIETVTVHAPRKTTRREGAMSGVAKYCGEAGCSRGAFMYMSAAVMIRAFQGGRRAPKVVYRATERPDAEASVRPCQVASQPLDAADPLFLKPEPPV